MSARESSASIQAIRVAVLNEVKYRTDCVGRVDGSGRLG